jgi:hypothetical protein
MAQEIIYGPVNCACVIHGNAYDWIYVERLYSMLTRHISQEIKLHVYTEPDRVVPAPMIKHALTDWGISGPKKSWWYKMQLFNSQHYAGPLLYFDLDVVIVNSIDWIWLSSLDYFWSVRDFKYLWKPTSYIVNSSIMWWDTQKFAYIYRDFVNKDLAHILKQYHGDQDYITDSITAKERKFLDTELIKSYRWQTLDGGYNFSKKSYKSPGAGTNITDCTSVLVFHGNPKPGIVQDPAILQHWQ